MPEDTGLCERVIEAARILGSESMDCCPDERYCGLQDDAEYDSDTCCNCWARYILTGE